MNADRNANLLAPARSAIHDVAALVDETTKIMRFVALLNAQNDEIQLRPAVVAFVVVREDALRVAFDAHAAARLPLESMAARERRLVAYAADSKRVVADHVEDAVDRLLAEV